MSSLIFERTQGFARFRPVTPNSESGPFHTQQPSCHYNVFHANLITPYKETAIHRPNYSRPPPDLVDGEEEFKVEQILDMKQMGQGRKVHYLVKWKGYPTSDNSREPEKNLNADELIAEFKWSFRSKKTKAKKVFIRAG